MAVVETKTVERGEDGSRLDRWFKRHYPHVNHVQLEKLLRTGQVRVNGARVKASQRLEINDTIRIPPLPDEAAERPASTLTPRDVSYVKSLVIYEDEALIAFNKPSGLAVQGGTKTTRHLDGLLAAWGQGTDKPRLVHRLDRDTSGVIVVGKTPKSAAHLAGSFAKRRATKTYLAIVAGQPHPLSGTIDMNLIKDGPKGQEKMRPAQKGEKGSERAITRYRTVARAGGKATLLALSPHTGRTHQLRAHMAAVGHPIVGDPKYHDDRSAILRADLKLQLHAYGLIVPHPDGGVLRLSAPPSPEFAAGLAHFGFSLDEAGENMFDENHDG